MKLRKHNGKIYIGEFSFEEIAEKYGTPFYLYDLAAMREKIRNVRRAFGDAISLYYAMKANPNLGILKAIREDVDGLDISSIGEMEQGLLAGYDPAHLSFAGPGKTYRELEEAIQRGVGIISVESMRELQDISRIASTLGLKANIALRLNPRLLIKDFAIKMGGKATQFGIDEEYAAQAISFIKQNEDAFNFFGIHIYAGTQCLSEKALAQNMINTLEIAANLRKEFGIDCRWINLGGGFGVSYYEKERELDLVAVSREVEKGFNKNFGTSESKPHLIIELGRYLVASSGIYVTRVVSEKESRGEKFYVLDGGMNQHLAASGNLGAMLRKNYLVKNLSNADSPKEKCNLVGPLCTPLDLMGRSVVLEHPNIGDLIGFLNSGSYGFTASPLLFLGHETPVELLLENNELSVIRKRKGISDFN